LVQTLDRRHFLSLLGRFETVGQQDHALADADQAAGKEAEIGALQRNARVVEATPAAVLAALKDSVG